MHALELLLLRLLHHLLLPPLPLRRVALLLMPRGIARRSLGLQHAVQARIGLPLMLSRRTPPRHRRRAACRGGG